jgi:multidrug efflux system membrane fusion protein
VSLRIHFALVAAFLAGCLSQAPKTQSGGPPPAVPVSVAVAAEESVPNEIHAVGTVEASSVIQVKSQIAGELVKVAFTEGADVHEGDLLFQIDARPYQEALRQAEAALARDTAQWHQAEANLAKDAAQSKSLEADAIRYAQLAKEGITSRSQNEQTQAAAETNRGALKADQAAIDSARASIDSDRSSVETAKLNLSYCDIHSPITGRAGNLLVHQGNLIGANGSALVVIHQLEPIWVSFGVPEDQLPAIRRNSAGRKLEVQASLEDTADSKSKQTLRGLLSVIDNTVDTTTGTIRLKATFDNEKRILWPGTFVNVSLTLDTQARAIVVPSEAVQPGQQGQMVWVAKEGGAVEPRTVSVGATTVNGNKVIIEKGVAAGETVVTDGQLRLFPGARIQAVPASQIDSRTP